MADPDSRIIKKAVTLNGHRTSVSLESAYWQHIQDWCRKHDKSLNGFIADIDAKKNPAANLSSAIRVAVLKSLTHGSTSSP